MARMYLAIAFAGALLTMSQEASAQICRPVAERTAELGCWIVANGQLGTLSKTEVFWQLDIFPTRAAADVAKTASGTVVEALGKTWLLTIGDAGWKPTGGERAAEIGPLPIRPGENYSAQYMEAIFSPGMTAPSHTHPGPEAWYTLSGETCLETPDGKQVGRAGEQHVIVPGGPPMHLTATGTETRRALVLILHDASKPATAPAPHWTPKGLCKS